MVWLNVLNYLNLKGDDNLVSAFISQCNNLFVSTNDGFGLWFDINDVPIVGLKTSGVKSINLKDDYVVSINNFGNEQEYITIITEKGTAKRVKIDEFEKSARARRGLMIIKTVKSNPYKIVKTFAIDNREYLGIKTDEIEEFKLTNISIMDRYSTGGTITKKKITDAYVVQKLLNKNDKIEVMKKENNKLKKKINDNNKNK